MAAPARPKQTRLRFDQTWDADPVLRPGTPKPYYRTDLGMLFEGDCLDILPHVESDSVDTIFADPPFNFGKPYGEKFDDRLSETDYVAWCKRWLDECVRVTKPGGAIFVYNLPKWNILLGAHLMGRHMTFRHDIAISIKASLPIQGRLYPAHYSLLYFTKGKPKTFRKIRTPIEICRHCGRELKDYGGHRDAMNPLGVNLMDVWTDIPPVRHRKFKSEGRTENQLSTKLVSRAIQISTRAGELVLDPFGGAGTTFDVCESLHMHWLGVEIQNCDVIKDRLEHLDVAHHRSDDYLED